MCPMVDTKNLGAVDDLTYEPSDAERRAKAQFWAKYYDDPKMDRNSISLAAVLDYTGDSRISRWWGKPGFKEWFCNKDEWRQRQEYLVNLAQSVAEDILLDPKANPTAKVALIKFLTESIGRAEARIRETKMLDAAVHNMTAEQLEEFIRSSTKKLSEAK